MNSDQINNSSFYIGRVISLDKETWVITFVCDTLNEEAELKAVPLFNHTYEILPDDQILILKPNENFSDNLFYLPITLRKFIGLMSGESYIDMTNPERLFINSPISIVIQSGNGRITISNNLTSIQGNAEVLGNLKVMTGWSGSFKDSNGVVHTVDKGIVIS